MPVLHVRALPQADPSRIPAALGEACAAIAEFYGCRIDQVWATWEELKPGHYVEGRRPADSQPLASHPPIAEITAFEGKSDETIEKVLTAAAAALTRELNLPGNIFLKYVESESGRVIAGDGLVRH